MDGSTIAEPDTRTPRSGAGVSVAVIGRADRRPIRLQQSSGEPIRLQAFFVRAQQAWARIDAAKEAASWPASAAVSRIAAATLEVTPRSYIRVPLAICRVAP